MAPRSINGANYGASSQTTGSCPIIFRENHQNLSFQPSFMNMIFIDSTTTISAVVKNAPYAHRSRQINYATNVPTSSSVSDTSGSLPACFKFCRNKSLASTKHKQIDVNPRCPRSRTCNSELQDDPCHGTFVSNHVTGSTIRH